MKRIIILLMILACILQVKAYTAEWEFDRMAVKEAVFKAESSLKRAPFGGEPVALLPLKGDEDGIVAATLKTMLTKIGFNCVEGKEDPMWNEIIKEIEWDERKDDILQPATVVRFGKLQAAKILIYGGIRTIDQNVDRVYAEVDLHATNLVTKQHIWGGTFASRVYFGVNVNGIIALDNSLKQLLKKNFNDARDSMRQPAAAERLANVKSVAIVPLVGDVDQYMTGLAIEMLTETNHAPKQPKVPSLMETRMAVRNHSLACDAVFYGYVRDLSKTQTVYRQLPKEEKVEASCTYNAEIQMFMENAATGAVLWSKTVTMVETVREERIMTVSELRKALQDHDERENLKRIRLEKAEKEGSFKRVAKEMERAVRAARAALSAGRCAEVLILTESVLNRADDDAQAAVWKKEAATLRKSAEAKLKAYNIDQIDQEVQRAVLAAREAKKAGKWDDVRLYVEAATRISGGSEVAAKWRQEAMTILAQAESWKLDQSLSKVDAEIESLLKTAREAMKTNRLDVADIYAKMALRMEGGTPKADMLRNEAQKLVNEIANAIKGAKIERIDTEIKGMVDAARNAMQQRQTVRLAEAAIYAKIAASIEGGSPIADNLRKEANRLVQEINDELAKIDSKQVENEINQALMRAEQAYQNKKWDDALYLARAAMNMVDFSRTASSLKTRAESLKKQIEIALQDEEISSTVVKAQASYEMDDLNKARGYAMAAIGMDYASERAKNQRTKAQGLLEAIKIRMEETRIEREDEDNKQQLEALRSEVAQAEAALKLKDTRTASQHVLTAIGMPGDSDEAKSLKAKAQALLEDIRKEDDDIARRLVIEAEKHLAEAIENELNLAIASKEGGLLEKALQHAITASGMAGKSAEAINLKAKAKAEIEIIKRLIEDGEGRTMEEAIKNIMILVRSEYAAKKWTSVIQYATTVMGMPGDSDGAKALKAEAQGLKETAEKEISIIDKSDLVKTVAVVILCLIGIGALLILVKMWIEGGFGSIK